MDGRIQSARGTSIKGSQLFDISNKFKAFLIISLGKSFFISLDTEQLVWKQSSSLSLSGVKAQLHIAGRPAVEPEVHQLLAISLIAVPFHLPEGFHQDNLIARGRTVPTKRAWVTASAMFSMPSAVPSWVGSAPAKKKERTWRGETESQDILRSILRDFSFLLFNSLTPWLFELPERFCLQLADICCACLHKRLLCKVVSITLWIHLRAVKNKNCWPTPQIFDLVGSA